MIEEASERNLWEDVYVKLDDAFKIENVQAKEGAPKSKQKSIGEFLGLSKQVV